MTANVLVASSIVALYLTAESLSMRGQWGGWDELFFSMFIYLGAIPYLAMVLIVATSVFSGGLTRFRLFAFGMGVLTPVLMWVGLTFFTKAAASA